MILASTAPREKARPFTWLERVGALEVIEPAPGTWLAHDRDAEAHRDGDVTVVAEPPRMAATVARLAAARGPRDLDLSQLAVRGSFALYDARTRALAASSDMFSRAPIAYWSNQGHTVLSSDLLALLRDPF